MRRPLAAVAALALLSGCATVPAADRTPGDPLEGFNRRVWGINQGLDRAVIRPVSSGYRAVVPRQGRRGVSNFFSNLSEPWSFINNLLQAKPGRAANNLGRFVVNSTIGVLGLFDQATRLGIRPKPEDFGQTLAKWGARSSSYLMLPLLGPSTIRDGVGTGVAFVADPYRVGLNNSGIPDLAQYGVTALSVVDIRAQLTESGADAFLESSLDPYASARSAFLQRREAAIADREAETPAAPGAGNAPPAGSGTSANPADADLDAALKELDATAPPAGATPRPAGAPDPEQPKTDPQASPAGPVG